MKIGNYKLTVINSGLFKLDGGAMFGIIPKPLWEKTNPADPENRIQLATRNLLLQNGTKTILIDTGMGTKWDKKSEQIYEINQSTFSLETELRKRGINPEDITDVILTHLHFDHTGGSTKIEDGKLVPAFPNAKYHVQKKNYEWAVNPSDRDKGSYIKENFVPLYEAGVLNFFDGNDFLDDEIQLVTVNGHTFSQQLVMIMDMENTILYCGDLFPTTSHIRIPYVMGYDLQPLVTVQEKKQFLSFAVANNWKLFFEHDTDTVLATIKYTEKGFAINEKFNSL